MSEDGIRGTRSARMSKCAVTLAFVSVIGSLGMSAPAFAEPQVPFSASGPILTIDDGDVKAAGQSGRFIVRERRVEGTLTGSIGGTTGVPFVITYDSNVPIATQSGQIHARFIAGAYEANMTLASSTGPTEVPCDPQTGAPCIVTPNGSFFPGLLLNGKMNFLNGAKGQGNVTGWLIPEFDAQGHIVGIVASLLMIVGQWTQ